MRSKTVSRRSFVLPLVTVASGMLLLAAGPPQPSDMPAATQGDNLRAAAATVNAKRADAYRRKDVAGIAAEYTADATYVELLPRLEVMKGRAQIQQHFHDLMAANANDLATNVTTAEMSGDGTATVGGDYSLGVAGGKRISGHFFQVLRKEGGTWKIAMQAFARPEPITSIEASEYHVGG